jgi:hypothetical protein
VRGRPQPSKRAAIPSAFLERTLATSVRALAAHARELAEREVRQRLAR